MTKKIDQAIVFVVAGGDAHGGDLAAILVEREAGDVAVVFEGAVAFVDVEEVGFGVVADHEVGFAVGIDGDEEDGEAVELVLVFDAGLDGDVGEVAVAVVVEEMVGLAGKAARAAVDVEAAILALGIADGLGAADGQVVAVEVDVAGDVEVEIAVAVVVAPGGAGMPVAEGDAGLFGHVGKRAVMVVVVEAVLAVVADEEVGPAVVVVIGHGAAVTPAVVLDAGFL